MAASYPPVSTLRIVASRTPISREGCPSLAEAQLRLQATNQVFDRRLA